ncbi:MAG TPA: methyltransferase domain-containing protein [Chitinivibrionales bacterium]|nr:methyltransferase domain-containing protein [Chitinivibrionales bacterium]
MPTQSDLEIRRFNEWAKTYDRSFLQRLFFGPIHSRVLDICNSSAAPPASVLDVGCGTGRLLYLAATQWPGAKFSGADPAPNMISAARRLNPNAEFTVAKAESLPLPDHSADLVMSSMSFHHWEDQRKALKEIARVLQPGGRFCLADHTAVLANLHGEHAKSKGQLRLLFEEAGLDVVIQKRMWTRFVLISVGQKKADR